MKNIICVDLTLLSNDELKEFSSSHDLLYSSLLDFKEKTYAKLWITKDDGICVAFTLTKENDFEIEDFVTVRMFDKFLTELSKVKPYQVTIKPVILDVDIILEKIFKYGKGSLTSEEKDFLDNQ